MSYLRNWFSLDTAAPPRASTRTTIPGSFIEEGEDRDVDEDEDDGSNTAGEDDSDVPPAFPALNSAQRATSSSASASASTPSSSSTSNAAVAAFRGIPVILNDDALMPPPPLPDLTRRQSGVPRAQPQVYSSSSSLSPSPSLLTPMATTERPKKPSRKVALAPGFGPLDWASLKSSSGRDLRGVETLLRIPPSVLKLHNKKEDAWTAIHGKVYNITPYLPYHPGGEKELIRVAGKDGSKLFSLTHAWVNVEFMLDACLVGFLVSESYAS